MSFLFHRGCKGSCWHDTYHNQWCGRILGIGQLIGYSTKTQEGMQQAFEDAVDGYLGLVNVPPGTEQVSEPGSQSKRA